MGINLAILYMLKHSITVCFYEDKYSWKPFLERPGGWSGLMIYFLWSP